MEKDISMAEMPEGTRVKVFLQLNWKKWSDLQEKILSGLCLLPLPVAVLNLWQRWVRIMILHDLALKELVFLHANVIC